MRNIELPATSAPATSARPPLSLEGLRRRLHLLRWLAPAGLLVLVIFNELGLARWVHLRLGDAAGVTLNILIYGSVGPLLAYLLLTLIGRWLEERETSQLQSQALHRVRAQVQRNHDLTDDALQTMFATSLVLDTLTDSLPQVSPEAAARFHDAEQAVNRAIEQLYTIQKQIKS